MNTLLTEALFFLILINPISKVVIANMLPKTIDKETIQKLLIKSNLIAFGMLVLFAFGGRILLKDIFQIDINALRLAGGIVLAIMGFRALDKGLMFSMKSYKSLVEMAIVPLASPFIAGPATISATILKANTYSPYFVCLALFIAISINMTVSLISLKFKNVLDKYNIMGTLIRITGLFIMAMGLNMVLVAVSSFGLI